MRLYAHRSGPLGEDVVQGTVDADGRVVIDGVARDPAELTPAGIEARNLCHNVLVRAEGQMLADLSADERHVLGRSLERCLVGLCDPTTEAAVRDGALRLRSRPQKVTAEP